ncbi:hypothetical protein EJ06DRAFT_527719 [Trichodelitschia bisporula]|uniref:Uncharacterized protein n=1 Tax=Trichodelitschia bisporula TaxID=703511 RepID=A0A6G1I3P3_9PEZI|nr:hypothetical protein EJ06DRAFT_527719 [Trichodelitschia bisporula]
MSSVQISSALVKYQAAFPTIDDAEMLRILFKLFDRYDVITAAILAKHTLYSMEEVVPALQMIAKEIDGTDDLKKWRRTVKHPVDEFKLRSSIVPVSPSVIVVKHSGESAVMPLGLAVSLNKLVHVSNWVCRYLKVASALNPNQPNLILPASFIEHVDIPVLRNVLLWLNTLKVPVPATFYGKYQYPLKGDEDLITLLSIFHVLELLELKAPLHDPFRLRESIRKAVNIEGLNKVSLLLFYQGFIDMNSRMIRWAAHLFITATRRKFPDRDAEVWKEAFAFWEATCPGLALLVDEILCTTVHREKEGMDVESAPPRDPALVMTAAMLRTSVRTPIGVLPFAGSNSSTPEIAPQIPQSNWNASPAQVAASTTGSASIVLPTATSANPDISTTPTTTVASTIVTTAVAPTTVAAAVALPPLTADMPPLAFTTAVAPPAITTPPVHRHFQNSPQTALAATTPPAFSAPPTGPYQPVDLLDMDIGALEALLTRLEQLKPT